MDSRVHARFFRVSPPPVGTEDFDNILLEDAAIPKVGDRERALGEGITARLEHCAIHQDYVEGEFCRVQTGNFPPQTSPDGLEPIPLEAGKGIGHVVAFLYHRPTRVLLLQRNINAITVNRLSLYLAATKPDRLFTFAPVLGADAMERFIAKRPRGFAITFAGPENLQALDDAGIPVAKGAKLIAEAYEGVRVKIEVSVGRNRKKWLSKDSVFAALGGLVDADGVKALKVKAESHGENDLINFLKEQLHGEDVLTLPEGKPEENYIARKLFLRKLFSDNMESLQRQFGKP